MKKLLFALSLLGLAAAPKASIIKSYEDLYDPENFVISAGESFSYTHDLNHLGFNSENDTIFYANYRLFVRDDETTDGPEVVDINFDATGYPGSFTVYKTFYNFDVDFTLLQLDGKMNVTFTVNEGDLTFKHSFLWVDTHTVPEPTTVGLFGLGLVGMGLALRRKKA